MTELSAELYRKIHAAIDRFAGGKFSRRHGKAYFDKLIKIDPNFKNEVVDALTTIYTDHTGKDSKLMKDFLQNIGEYLNSYLKEIRESEVLFANLLFRILWAGSV